VSERTVVHLLRHGEVHNPEKLLYGRLPGYRLSELGERMAVRAAEFFAHRDIVRVVSSPLERARQTATPVAEKFGLDVQQDDRLIESENVFEGSAVGVGDGVLKDPRNWRYLTNPFRPSWGEPYSRVALRMHAATEVAREAARGHETVLVSHQLPIWVARLSAEHRHLWHDPRRRQCSLASVTSFTYEGDRLVSIAYTEPAADLLPQANRMAGA
jgi:broad specificity phosphatase PhoE